MWQLAQVWVFDAHHLVLVLGGVALQLLPAHGPHFEHWGLRCCSCWSSSPCLSPCQCLTFTHTSALQCSCFSASDLCPLTLSRKWWVLSSLFCSPTLSLKRMWCTAAPSSSGADSDSGAALPQLGRRLGRLAFAAQPPRGKLSDVYTITTRQSVNNSKTR